MTLRAALCCAVLSLTACADDQARDTSENSEPFTRVVTLAPHLAELAFAAGAGPQIVGVSAYSDYPEAATALPIVSDAFTVDQEMLRVLAPDLVLAWASGMPASTIEQLKSTGLNVVTIDTRGLDDIAAAVRRIGELTGQEQAARAEAERFETSLAALADEYANRRKVRVFYQISARPLYTINGRHFISELLGICGGVNVFESLDELAPAIDVEAVLASNPEAIVTLGSPEALGLWERFEALDANRFGNRVLVEAEHLARASTRLDSAARELCERLEIARQRLPAAAGSSTGRAADQLARLRSQSTS